MMDFTFRLEYNKTNRMQKLYKYLVLASLILLVSLSAQSQSSTDTTITSIDADLINIFTQKAVKSYKVANVKVVGNRFFDENLLISIANINIGDEIKIPGGDNFSKAITKLWAQNYFSNVEIYLTNLEGKNISVEIQVTERPRLSKFYFRDVRKTESEDLSGKTGLVPNRVVTENMKITAMEAIKKFYAEKGFQDAKVKVVERKDSSANNTLTLNFFINKGSKVHINNINFGGNNTVEESKLKKQLKDTKEQSRLTLFPTYDKGMIVEAKHYTFDDYLKEHGYLTFSRTKKILDPYIRLKFSSAKFDSKKFTSDLDNILEYYNTLGYRDAVILKDTVYHTKKGDLNIDIKLSEGRRYYFGNISWRGNTKFGDSVLTTILGIRKGDIYNMDILNKKLGKNSGHEGGDISGL